MAIAQALYSDTLRDDIQHPEGAFTAERTTDRA